MRLLGLRSSKSQPWYRSSSRSEIRWISTMNSMMIIEAKAARYNTRTSEGSWLTPGRVLFKSQIVVVMLDCHLQRIQG